MAPDEFVVLLYLFGFDYGLLDFHSEPLDLLVLKSFAADLLAGLFDAF